MASFEISNVIVRTMNQHDISKVVQLTAEEDWTVTQFDLKVYVTCYPEDYFVAEIKGQIIGKIYQVKFLHIWTGWVSGETILGCQVISVGSMDVSSVHDGCLT